MSIADIFAKLQSKLDNDPSLAGGLQGVVQMDVRGADGGQYFVRLDSNGGAVSEGTHPAPSLTLTVNSRDLRLIADGQLNPAVAALRGRLRMRGDMKLAGAIRRLLQTSGR